MNARPALPFRVLVITDEGAARAAGRGVVETVARALGVESPRPRSLETPHPRTPSPAAGEGDPVTRQIAVLVRAKERSLDEVRALCTALRPITTRAGALLLVHTHVRLVDELGLDGAHLSSTDEPRKARALLRMGALLGASRHAGDALDEGALAPLDYITMSPVFPPSSKPDDVRDTLGPDGLHRAVSSSARPVIALGGIDARRAPACLRAGALGVAVIGDVMSAHDPRRALDALF